MDAEVILHAWALAREMCGCHACNPVIGEFAWLRTCQVEQAFHAVMSLPHPQPPHPEPGDKPREPDEGSD